MLNNIIMEKLKNGDYIDYIIEHQGEPIINSITILEAGERIVAIQINLQNSNVKVDCTFSTQDDCGMYISEFKDGYKIGESTLIRFSEFDGWYILCHSNIRHNQIAACLIKY